MINILHLRYAVEVAKIGSINKAAESLHVSQPNLSRAIKELESSTGIVIFKRSPRGIALTPEGEYFIDNGVKLIDQLDNMESLYGGSSKLKKYFLISVPRASYIADAFVRFVKEQHVRPTDYYYVETNTKRALHNLTDEGYHLAVIRCPFEARAYYQKKLKEMGLLAETIGDFSSVIVFNKNHPLAVKDSVTSKDLKPYTQISYTDQVMLHVAPDEHDFLPSGRESSSIYVFERASRFELLGQTTDTYTVTSPLSGYMLDRFGLAQRPCRDMNRVYRDMLVYKREYRFTDLDVAFLDQLAKVRDEIRQSYNDS